MDFVNASRNDSAMIEAVKLPKPCKYRQILFNSQGSMSLKFLSYIVGPARADAGWVYEEPSRFRTYWPPLLWGLR